MKFMKLGSRPDTFYATEAVRSISSEVSSDLIIQVKASRYLLHKFPLLSKCLRLQRLCSDNSPDSSSSSQHQVIQLPDFPGGAEAFELCAKFCYGITITLSAYNIVAARCAAEYLQMTEDAEKGNLVYKIEVFLNSCVLNGWRDSIITLQATKPLALWSEELGITPRCVDAIASKILANPAKVSLSHSYSRRGGGRDDASSNGRGSSRQTSKGWWGEDLAELEIDLYWRTMIGVKSGGKIPASLVGDALRIYASKWLPGVPKNGFDRSEDSDSDAAGDAGAKRRLLLESIVSLLPSERGAVSCGFLLKLLKAASILKASSSSKAELARRVALQLEEAAVSDLLIPCGCGGGGGGPRYDVDIVMTILEQFMMQGQQSPPARSPPRSRFVGMERRRRSRSAENIDFEFQESRRSSSASHSSKLKVTKLVDGYLQEVAREVNLGLNKFISIAEAIPEFSRIDHDDLYRAIDIYLKAHPELNKSDRKRLCRILDCKKLSMEACMHAAQNEMLPLRVVVQVLFFEQARATMCGGGGGKVAELPSHIRALLASHGIDPSKPSPQPLSSKTTTTFQTEDQWSSVPGLKSPTKSTQSKVSTLRMKLAEEDGLDESDVINNNGHEIGRTVSNSKLKALCALPNRPKKMLSKLWSTSRAPSEKN